MNIDRILDRIKTGVTTRVAVLSTAVGGGGCDRVLSGGGGFDPASVFLER